MYKLTNETHINIKHNFKKKNIQQLHLSVYVRVLCEGSVLLFLFLVICVKKRIDEELNPPDVRIHR